MDHTTHEDSTTNIEQENEYPVLRLANPLPGHQYPNDNDNNMYYQHDNDNLAFESPTTIETKTDTSTSITTTPKNSSITNLTGTVTNSHPLMYSPTSPISPISPDFPDLIPEKKHTKSNYKSHSTLSKNLSQGTKYSFKPEAHSSHINLHKIGSLGRKHTYSTSAEASNASFDTAYKVRSDIVPSNPYNERVLDIPEHDIKPNFLHDSNQAADTSDTENDKSIYEATLSPNLQNVSLTMNEKSKSKDNPSQKIEKRRRISVIAISDMDDSDDVSSVDSRSESLKSDEVYDETEMDTKINTQLIRELLEGSEEIGESMFENLSLERSGSNDRVPKERSDVPEPIEEYSVVEERRDSRHWQKIVLPSGEHRSIDMRVIEPYKRVLSHGGYLKAGGHNAIIVFSACFLPDKSRVDYDYVMDNLFLYVLSTLEHLVTEDYVLVYLHGGAGRAGMPSFSWIKRCYQLVDRRLRKNLKRLYLVHPTFWVKALVIMCKPFISSKFYKKITFVSSLAELADFLPIEQASIPDRVKNYEKMKFSC